MFSKKLTIPHIPFFIIFFSLVFGSCKKVTYEEALPKTELISVQLIDEETAEIKGRVIAEGGSKIKYTGFSYSTKPNPGMEDNQIVLNGTDGIFETQVKVMPDSTYYFRCFAINEFGYQLSNIRMLEVPHPEPKTAPCTLTENKIVQNGRTYPISTIYAGKNNAYWGEYGIDVSNYQTGGPRLRMDFHKIPANGIYITNSSHSLFSDLKNQKEVYLRIDDNYVAESGDSIYVSENPDGKLTISFCNIRYVFFNTPMVIGSKFTFDK